MERHWIFENHEGTADAFNRFCKVRTHLLKFIAEGRQTICQYQAKRPSRRRAELINGYTQNLDLAERISELHKHDEILAKIDLPVTPIGISFIPRSEEENQRDRAKFIVFHRGEAYWLRETIPLNDMIILLLSHPFGRWGAKYEISEATGQLGGEISTKSKPGFFEFAEEIIKSSAGKALTQAQLWNKTENYINEDAFLSDDGSRIYRDGAKLCLVDINGRVARIGFDAFRKTYLKGCE